MKEKSISIFYFIFALLFVNRTSAQLNGITAFQNNNFQIPEIQTTIDAVNKSGVEYSDNCERRQQLTLTPQTQLNKDQILMELDKINGRKNRDLILFLITYSLTFIGDYTVEGDVFYGSFIPVLGPFLNIAEIGDYKGADTDKTLFLLSGVLQTYFSIDYLLAFHKEGKLKQQLYLSLNPM